MPGKGAGKGGHPGGGKGNHHGGKAGHHHHAQHHNPTQHQPPRVSSGYMDYIAAKGDDDVSLTRSNSSAISVGRSSFEEDQPPMPRGSTLGFTRRVTKAETSDDGPNPGCLSLDKLAMWMENACLECAVASNTAGEQVWEEVCGVGFSLQIDHHRPVPLDTELEIKTELIKGLSRQITFHVEARGVEDGRVYAKATHLRSYVPWDTMRQKVNDKLSQNQLCVGMRGTSAACVEEKHLGGYNDVADPDGPVAECASTASIIGFMENAVAAAVQGFLPHEHLVISNGCKVDHLSPTPRGFVVTAEAELTEMDGNKLTFKVNARDPFDQVATAVMVATVAEKSARMSAVCQQ